MGWGKRIAIGFGDTAAALVAVLAIILVPMFKGAPLAELRADSGTVEAKTADDWIPASSGMKLAEGNSVRTKEGSATIIFFGSSLLRMDADTEVVLVDLDPDSAKIVINQPNGKTWNRVVKKPGDFGVDIPGVKEYEVQLPTGVATVRGTAFSAASIGVVSVVRGQVAVKKGDQEEIVELATADFADTLQLRELERDSWIESNEQQDQRYDDELVNAIRQRYRALIAVAKSRYGVTDEQVDAIIRAYLRGEPIPTPGEPQEPECGNGVHEAAEQCDDGNRNENDACKNDCTSNVCGDGVVRSGVEQCDDGNRNNGDGCNRNCRIERPAVCGNRVQESGEQCDDGNTQGGDGCSSTCQREQAPSQDFWDYVGQSCTNGAVIRFTSYGQTCNFQSADSSGNQWFCVNQNTLRCTGTECPSLACTVFAGPHEVPTQRWEYLGACASGDPVRGLLVRFSVSRGSYSETCRYPTVDSQGNQWSCATPTILICLGNTCPAQACGSQGTRVG